MKCLGHRSRLHNRGSGTDPHRSRGGTSMRSLGLAVLLCLVVAAGSAAGSSEPDLSKSYLFSPAGMLTPLRAHLAYQASLFPVAVRIAAPDKSWSGTQWKANLFSPEDIATHHLTCHTNPGVCRPPYYGWVAIGQTGTPGNHPPLDLILIMTGYTRTPSVTSTVASLRTRGHGATYEPTVPVKLAGFSGFQFDGQVVAAKHIFIPFSPLTHKATGHADEIEMDGAGHSFRFIVLDVRGRTVIVMVSSIVMPVDQFTSFLPRADALLASLRFPR
jgi:hypothetical protein